jgi:hypothetical protein
LSYHNHDTLQLGYDCLSKHVRKKANRHLVNELSGTIDLQSTLITAEALFNRFQRTVEAVDRKDHFPTPSNVRQRRPGIGSPQSSQDGNTSVTTGILKPTPALINKPKAPVAEGSTDGVATTPVSPSQARPGSAGKGKRKSVDVAAVEDEITKEKVITSELRDLLKRDVYYRLEKGEIGKHGGGVGS